MSWFNNDKLLLKFGTEKATSTVTGEYKTFGPLHIVEYKMDMTKLTSSDQIFGDVTLIPKGAWLESVEVNVDVAAVGGTSVSVGLMKTDRTTTLGAAGLVSAEVTATLTLGNVLTYFPGVSKAGTLLGTATTFAAHITAKAVGTFSAGSLTIRVRYRDA